MTRTRLILPAVIALAILAGFPSRAQDDVLLREGDESAVSLSEREHTLAILQAAALRFREAKELSKAAGLMNRVGWLQLRLDLPADALTTYRDALALITPTSAPSTYIDSLNGVSTAQDQLSQCDQAQTGLRQAIALSEQHNYVAGKAQALLTLSDCQNANDHALALNTAQEALALYKSIGHKIGLANSYGLIGDYQLAQTNLPEATLSYEAAQALWRELNIAPEQAGSLINLGFIEYRKGAWQNSISFLTQAQFLIDEKSERFKMGQISAGLGEAFMESGLPEVGLPKFEQAREYFRESKSPQAMLVMSWDVGKAHFLMGNYSQALATLQQALATANEIKQRHLAGMCDEYLGRTYAALNDRAKALSHLQDALAAYDQVRDPMEAARTRALIGMLHGENGEIGKARQEFSKALRVFAELSDRLNEAATLYALGRLELHQKNLDVAEGYLRKSIDATEDIRRASTSSDLISAFSATVYERYESYVECLMRKHQAQPKRGLDVLAFETSELARARSLTELLRATQTNFVPGLDPQLAEQEKSLRQSLRVKEDYRVALLGQSDKKHEMRMLETEIASLDDKYRQVTGVIAKRYPPYDQISRPGAWSLRQIQSEVIADNQTVLLEYSLGVDKSYVWAVTRAGITSYELAPQKVINEAARKVYELLAKEPKAETENELDRAVGELTGMVLSPVASELNKARIIVVADGALNYIPFQLLPAPSTPGQQLVASYEVVNAPSATVLGQLRQETSRRQRPANVLAAFGDPVFPSNFGQQDDRDAGAQLSRAPAETGGSQKASRDIQPAGDSFDPAKLEQLFFSKLELSNLRAVAGRNTLLVTRFEATPDKLRTTDLTKYSILHLATHGILDPKHPERSGLVLSTVNSKGQNQNGFVGLQDIYSLRAPVDLVVLSACRTGLGKDVRGEGLIGLTRGFIYAGASSVVASLWKVDDEATAELMKRFYVNMLQHGMRPPAALRAAQNSIRLEPQWRAPYYWAAFTLQGEYLQTIKSAGGGANNYQRFLAGGYCLAVLAAGFWWYFRHRVIQS